MNIIMKALTIIFVSLLFVSFSHAEGKPKYLWDHELHLLADDQRAFVVDIVKAYRNSDITLGQSRLHSSIKSNKECLALFEKKFKSTTIKEQYAVKVKPGKKPESLSFSIRDQQKGDNSKRNFHKMKNVVTENGKLVINMNCESALKFIKRAQASN